MSGGVWVPGAILDVYKHRPAAFFASQLIYKCDYQDITLARCDSEWADARLSPDAAFRARTRLTADKWITVDLVDRIPHITAVGTLRAIAESTSAEVRSTLRGSAESTSLLSPDHRRKSRRGQVDPRQETLTLLTGLSRPPCSCDDAELADGGGVVRCADCGIGWVPSLGAKMAR